MSGPGIEFRDLSVHLGGQAVLTGISFGIRPAEVHSIVGPNGGGKTTLVRALLGQIDHRGEIALDPAGALTIGYVPQFLELDRNLPITVLDLMAIMNQRRPVFLGRGGRLRAEQDAALARVGMAGMGRRLYGTLSGGERQRVLLAQALVPAPDLLIMDEPTSNMDRDGALLVERIVRELADGGTTVIWVNHDIDQVSRISDSVTRIARTVVGHGAAAQVMGGQAA